MRRDLCMSFKKKSSLRLNKLTWNMRKNMCIYTYYNTRQSYIEKMRNCVFLPQWLCILTSRLKMI